METSDSITEFWFGKEPDDAVTATTQARLWWAKDAAADQQIRTRFAATLADAAQGKLATWEATPDGRLALILLCDQFPRNMYRATPQAFGYDAIALRLCKDGIERGDDLALRPIERVFFYLPLEHSEALADQQLAVAQYEKLAAERHKKIFDGFLDFARRHQEVIARFGRFPHRNAILGRASTEAELAFLAQPGSSF
ncbi:MAG: DUF924 domain-containing protein [Burkholderiales bacterium]|nr:DUF924 domain-containing protein [Burkholderiales bacterium]